MISKKDFRLIEIIGIGGYGYVHKARKKDNKINYALKVMSKLRVYEKNSISSVLNERKLLTRINHPYGIIYLDLLLECIMLSRIRNICT